MNPTRTAQELLAESRALIQGARRERDPMAKATLLAEAEILRSELHAQRKLYRIRISMRRTGRAPTKREYQRLMTLEEREEYTESLRRLQATRSEMGFSITPIPEAR